MRAALEFVFVIVIEGMGFVPLSGLTAIKLREKRRVDKRSASTNTEIVMVDALRLSTLQQSLLTLNLMAVLSGPGMLFHQGWDFSLHQTFLSA
jgi:hypothetical protein